MCAWVYLCVVCLGPRLGILRAWPFANPAGCSPWSSALHSGSGTPRENRGGGHTGRRTCGGLGRGHLKQNPTYGQTMTGPGGGALLCVLASDLIRVWSSSPSLLLRCLCTARLATGWGRAWGPLLFTDLAIGREVRSQAGPLPPAPYESEVDVGLQVTPPPRVSGPKLQGKDLTLRLRTSPAPPTQICT